MKICFYLSNSLTSGGGADNWVIEVSKKLAERHEVSIAGLRYADERRLGFKKIHSILSRVKYYEFPFFKFPRGVAMPSPFHIDKLTDVFNSCDVTYVMVPRPPGEMILSFLRIKITCSLVAGFHGSLRSDIFLQRSYTPFLRKTLTMFDAFHAVNSETSHWLRGLGFDRIFLIPNAVDTDMFRLEEKQAYPIFKVLSVGRLAEEKGTDRLIEVIHYVNERSTGRNIKFVIAGSGPLQDTIEEIARKYENVEYLGWVPRDALPSLYASAHLFLMPSKTEASPLALLEAQSCGLPAVCSKMTGIADLISDTSKGRLVNLRDTEGFANAIYEYYELWHNSPEKYYELRKEIREYAVANYDLNATIGRLETMFRRCMEDRTTR